MCRPRSTESNLLLAAPARFAVIPRVRFSSADSFQPIAILAKPGPSSTHLLSIAWAALCSALYIWRPQNQKSSLRLADQNRGPSGQSVHTNACTFGAQDRMQPAGANAQFPAGISSPYIACRNDGECESNLGRRHACVSPNARALWCKVGERTSPVSGYCFHASHAARCWRIRYCGNWLSLQHSTRL